MLAKFVTDASGILFSWRDNSSYRLYTLGPLCPWQCFWEALKISIILKKLLAISMGLKRPLNFFNGFEETITRDTPKQAASVRNPS